MRDQTVYAPTAAHDLATTVVTAGLFIAATLAAVAAIAAPATAATVAVTVVAVLAVQRVLEAGRRRGRDVSAFQRPETAN